MSHYRYLETTIFGKNSERLHDHSLLANLDFTQPWGEVDIGVEMAQFFDDMSQYRVVVDGGLDFRITRGLNLQLSGMYAVIRDQRYLSAGELTDEEILLERQELATGYRFSFYAGISFTFGSIFNNVVNPRFAGSRSGFSRYF